MPANMAEAQSYVNYIMLRLVTLFAIPEIHL
jgi:hypothetical protein